MDTIDNNLFENSLLTEAAKDYLKTGAKWARFLAILGFIFVGLITIGAFSMGTLFAKLSTVPGAQGFGVMAGSFGAVFTVIYLLVALLYFFPTLFLFLFSTKMLRALKTTSSSDMTDSFKNLKSMFKFWGIFSIVILSIYGFALLIMLIVAVAS